MFILPLIFMVSMIKLDIILGGHDLDKRIIAALELQEHEVRLIVGQFYNGRLNILKIERVAHKGINNFKITNSNSVREAILKSIANASKNIGSQITSVLMLIPGVNLRVNQDLETVLVNQVVKQEDLVNVYNQFSKENILDGSVLTNVLINRYHINGIATRKLPINEKTHTMSVEATRFYADREVVFDYLRLVEGTGLEVIDIILDDLALAKEANLLEQSINNPVIAVTLERHATKLSLFNKGQLLSNVYLDHTFKEIFDKMHHLYGFKDDVIERLIYMNLDVSEVGASKDPIFAWTTKTKDHTLSKHDILEYIGKDVINILNEVFDTSKPIFDYGDAKFVLTGEASTTQGLVRILKSISKKDVTSYMPNGFGVKDPAFTTLTGAFYYYKDNHAFRETSLSSINEKEFYSKMIYKEKEAKEAHKSSTANFTKKIKDLFVE